MFFHFTQSNVCKKNNKIVKYQNSSTLKTAFTVYQFRQKKNNKDKNNENNNDDQKDNKNVPTYT